MLAWELVGAVVGAGLASGREIATFFAQYQSWSWFCIVLAVAVLSWLSDSEAPVLMRKSWAAKTWELLLSILLIATGGAMLSGAGEVAALTLPMHGAYWIGLTGTYLLAFLLAKHTANGLAWISRIMLGVLIVLISLGFAVSPTKATALENRDIPMALLRSVAYGGFNAALLVPILTTIITDRSTKKRAIMRAGFLIMLTLFLGNAVLLRHSSLMGEALPFLRMMGRYGKAGYCLGALALYLAVLSTLTACIRGLNKRWMYMGVMLVSLAGFSDVVERVYPLLGVACFSMLFTAKFLNSISTPFHSKGDVL